jgi:hypothetical protein
VSEPSSGWQAAAELRWKLASGALLDPFSLVGAAIAAWACHRAGAAWVGDDALRATLLAPGVLCALVLVSGAIGATLLYDRTENDLLRSLPLGERGFLKLSRKELGWWTVVPRALGAAAVLGGAGVGPALVVLVASSGSREAGLSAAIILPRSARQHVGRAAASALAVAAAAVAWLSPAVAPPANAALASSIAAGLLLLATFGSPARLWPRFGPARLSAASARPRTRGPAIGPWLDRILPLPGPARARLLRDLLLMLRGRDARALALFALSPLACIYLADELARGGTDQALTWRVLSAAALGGAAVAYAGGPGVHLLRTRALAWERMAPSPGRRHVVAALAWAMSFAALHGVLILATVFWADGGRSADLVPSLVLPVLVLETAMAHFVVGFVAGASDGQRVHGEGTIALMLPFVALGVALVGMLAPWAAPLYFLVTAKMVRDGARRIETMEVAW